MNADGALTKLPRNPDYLNAEDAKVLAKAAKKIVEHDDSWGGIDLCPDTLVELPSPLALRDDAEKNR